MEDFSDLSEEQIQQLIELGIIDDEQGILDKQLKQANYVRNAPGPDMRGNGRVMVAANPLEHAVHAAQGIQAGREAKTLADRQLELLRKQVEGRRQYYDALFSQQQNSGLGPMPTRNDEGIL